MNTSTAVRAHHGRAATYRHATLSEENALTTALRRVLPAAQSDLTAAAAAVGMTAPELALWLTDRRVPTDWTLPSYAA